MNTGKQAAGEPAMCLDTFASPLVSFENVTVRLRDRWLFQETDWQMNKGEHWAITGPNGAGKTTFVKAVAGMLPIVRGRIIRYFLKEKSPLEKVGYFSCDQGRDLFLKEQRLDHSRYFSGKTEQTTARDHILEKCRSADDFKQFEKISILSGITSLLDIPIRALSTGELLKVLIVRTLATRPRLLIMDEPFDGLDQKFSLFLKKFLSSLAGTGTHMLLVVHRYEEIMPFITHLMVLDQGRIVFSGKKNQIPLNRKPGQPHPEFKPSAPIFIATQKRAGKPVSTGDKKTLIRMVDVTVSYNGKKVLNAFDWCLRKGENWAITGLNGAGKSTVLKLISGDELQAYANQIWIFGKKRGTGETVWDIKKQMGSVSHETHATYPDKATGLEAVCSGFFDSKGLYKKTSQKQLNYAKRLMKDLSIHALVDAQMRHMSYGQRQLILIARAMIKSPALLILDEPCSGLDHENRKKILTTVNDICRTTSTNLIFVSHHEKEIPPCITHKIVLDQGRTLQKGPC